MESGWKIQIVCDIHNIMLASGFVVRVFYMHFICLFCSSNGIPVKDENGRKIIIYVGLIDIITVYNLKRMAESLAKNVIREATIQSPTAYAERLHKFLDVVFKKDKEEDDPLTVLIT